MAASRRHVQPLSGPEKAFGLAFRSIRKKLGISQERLSLEANSDRTTVSMIERGLVSPKLGTIVRLCRVLKVYPSEVIRRMERSPFYRA
jgi:transcriptional regulator with XRE-family HTH domain